VWPKFSCKSTKIDSGRHVKCFSGVRIFGVRLRLTPQVARRITSSNQNLCKAFSPPSCSTFISRIIGATLEHLLQFEFSIRRRGRNNCAFVTNHRNGLVLVSLIVKRVHHPSAVPLDRSHRPVQPHPTFPYRSAERSHVHDRALSRFFCFPRNVVNCELPRPETRGYRGPRAIWNVRESMSFLDIDSTLRCDLDSLITSLSRPRCFTLSKRTLSATYG